MTGRVLGLERTLLALFVASGFAGLIYQAIWSHYLGLTLGHAAYAQTLVLGIFMGGMALGAWLVSRRGANWKRLVFAYAVVEIIIGVAGLLFHPLFVAYTGFSLDVVYPALGEGGVVRAWQWGSAALLIAPQSILLGMTFPLMSGGYLRVAPEADGEILGGLYFSNSLGAAFGALAATFLLLPALGMPGTVAVAGGLNLLVGVVAWMVSRRADLHPVPASVAPAPARSEVEAAEDRGFLRVMLLAALITGASSFVYEIGWVRMLNQALGTTIHSFELMLAAFILGLAFGGLWIRKRSSRIKDAVAYAAYAQVWMGIAALASIPVFGQSFRWVGALVSGLPKTDDGYLFYTLGSGGIALLVMFPAAFFAGMTLPLFTMALLRRGAGEASIGRIYAANTLGAILGVFLAVHVLIPALGLRIAVTLAAVVDIALGLVLLKLFCTMPRPRGLAVASVLSVLAVAASLLLGRPDPMALASGVFRYGSPALAEGSEIHYLRDGKTSTIAFYSQGTTGIIATNGKPDASIELLRGAPPAADEITMAMAAALPLALHPNPERVAIIGWGSGLTTHVLLGSPAPKLVDSIEIEKAMYDGARQFGSRVVRAYQDPRSVVHFDDARTYFSAGHRKYDLIISEPSNPWVSGVASLFTSEFYGFMRSHLNEGGIAIQWLQTYEISDPLLYTMVAALIEQFPHVNAYTTNGGDLLFAVSANPIPPLDLGRLSDEPLASELGRVGLASRADFKVRWLGDREMLAALVALYSAQPHSDFYPTVSLNAPRSRFVGDSVTSLMTLARAGMPVLEITAGKEPASATEEVAFLASGVGARDHWQARWVKQSMAAGVASTEEALDPALASHLGRLLDASRGPVSEAALDDWLESAAVAADFSIGFLPPSDHAGLWIEPSWIDRQAQGAEVLAVLDAYAAAAARDPEAMVVQARRALELLDASRPAAAREQLLVIAMLGEIGRGDLDAAEAIERSLGRTIPAGPAYGFVRAYLLAWIDTQRGG